MGTDRPNHLPRALQLPAGGVDDVAIGENHMLVRTNASRVFSFGLNRFGQLGFCSSAGSWGPNGAPVELLLNFKVSGMAAGRKHSLLLAEDGGVWSFGSNDRGQLGILEQQLVYGGFVCLPAHVPDVPAGRQVAAGRSHSVLVSKEGQVWGFGNNEYGQLTGSPSSPVLSAVRMFEQETANLSIVSVGSREMLSFSVLSSPSTDESQVVLQGRNNAGQLDLLPSSSSAKNVLSICSFLPWQSCDEFAFATLQSGGENVFLEVFESSLSLLLSSRPPPISSLLPFPVFLLPLTISLPPPFPCIDVFSTQVISKRCRPGTKTAVTPNTTGHVLLCDACEAGKSLAPPLTTSALPPGKFSTQLGVTACSTCPEGTYSATGATSCEACQVLQYAGSGASACLECPINPSSSSDPALSSPSQVALLVILIP